MVLGSTEFSTDRCEADTDGITGRLKLYYSPSTIIAIPILLKGVAMFSAEFDVQMLIRNIPVSYNLEEIKLEHRKSYIFRAIRIVISIKNKHSLHQPINIYRLLSMSLIFSLKRRAMPYDSPHHQACVHCKVFSLGMRMPLLLHCPSFCLTHNIVNI